VTLAVTPLRKLTGWNRLAQVRRTIGLFAFFYAVIHLLIYFVFDRGLVFTELGEDILERPYITIGFTAWMILLALALTSPNGIAKWLGGRRWQRIHRLLYVAVPLGFVHFAWAQKKDLRPMLPFVLGAIAVVGFRLMARKRVARS
jgi:sulfoxide reductase heme-binding subunit YedZ